MKVILKEDISKLGTTGDIVTVRDGFARNYLLPQKKALLATAAHLQNAEHHKKALLKKLSLEKAKSEELAQKLSQFLCTIHKKVGKNSKLFGSVTSQDIQKQLQQNGYHIERKNIRLEEPIKTCGEFEVPIKLPSDVEITLKLTVKPQE